MIRRSLIATLVGITLSLSSGFAATSQAPTSIESQPKEKDIKHFFKVLYATHHFYLKNMSYKKLLDRAMEGMLSQLDPHSEYLDKQAVDSLHDAVSGNYVGIGIEIASVKGMLTIMSVLDGSPAKKAGLHSNDVIVKINNTLLNSISISEAVTLIKGKSGTKVRLSVLRQGEKKSLTFTVKRHVVHYNAVKSNTIEPGYIDLRLTMFQENMRDSIKKALDKASEKSPLKGIILDLRDNPGGLLTEANDLVGLFLTDKQLKRYHNESVAIKGRYADANETFTTHGSNFFKNIPIVVLINHGSASASEIVAGALQDYKRAIVVGQRSFGKGSVQSVIPINKNSAIKLTTSLYYTPAGQEIQAKGITPDIIIPNMSVTSNDTDELESLNEANFSNHLSGAKNYRTSKEARLDKNIALAKKDYALYQALTILKSIRIQHHS